MPISTHTETKFSATCDCCPHDHPGGPESIGYYPTRYKLTAAMLRAGWDVDYRGRGQVVCDECRAAGRVPKEPGWLSQAF